VRFSALRLGDPSDLDGWRLATVAELELHEHLLDPRAGAGGDAVTSRFARVARVGGPQLLASVARQLRLLRDAGDPADLLDAILELVSRPDAECDSVPVADGM
jgi:hypothetical protein